MTDSQSYGSCTMTCALAREHISERGTNSPDGRSSRHVTVADRESISRIFMSNLTIPSYKCAFEYRVPFSLVFGAVHTTSNPNWFFARSDVVTA